MSTTEHAGASLSKHSIKRERKSAWRKVWDLIRPWTTAFSVTLSVLSALYITAATGGSTSRALERLSEANSAASQIVVALTERVSHIETQADDIGRIFSKLDSISNTLEARGALLVSLDERFSAQQQRVALFWSTTWPSLETRLGRIESKIDKIK